MRETKPYRIKGRYLILILWIIATGSRGMGQLLVSEFQALNTTTITDPDFQSYSDWLELFNAGGSDLDISDYWLTDDLLQPEKWKIPAGQVIPAGGYLLIWADGRDTGLHAGFKLSGQGEAIGIFSPGGEIIDTVVYSAQRSDFSTGRVASSGRWVLFTNPTPGDSNPDSGFDGISGEPLFSIKGGFYSHPVDLLLSPPSAGGRSGIPWMAPSLILFLPCGRTTSFFPPRPLSVHVFLRSRGFREIRLPTVISSVNPVMTCR